MARRGRGEGSVYHRASDGRWIGSVSIPRPDGGRDRKTVSGKTQRIAREKLREIQGEVDHGIKVTDTMTVAEWVRYHLETISDNRGTTSATDRNYAKQWIYGQPIGKYPLRGLREDHIRVWHAQLKAHRGPRSPEGLSSATIHRIHTVLQAALKQAVRDRKAIRNVAVNVPPPKGPAKKPHHDQLTPDEARQLLDGTLDPRMRAREAVAFAGVEQSAALGLRWDECPPGLLRIVRTVHQITGQGLVIEDEAKALLRIREVPLGPAFTAIVEAWRIESGGEGWMFPGHNPKNPEGPRRDYNHWRDALAAAGVRHVPLHGARGTGASALKQAPVRVAADILGHARAEMTTDTYQRSSAAERLAATTAIESTIVGKKSKKGGKRKTKK